jgi:hypothetical protein
MYDDFWAGYNYGNNKQPQVQPQPQRQLVRFSPSTQAAAEQDRQRKLVQQQKPGIYDKSKFTRMQGPSGEQGEIYANGKMYITMGGGKAQVRTFPSRPFAITYMEKKGWVLI